MNSLHILEKPPLRSSFAAIAKYFPVSLAMIFFIGIAPLRCEIASPQEMEQVCRNWLTTIVDTRGQWAGSTNPRILRTDEIVENGTLLARYYSIDPAGYIIIPALKEMPPVKAYSEESSLDINAAGGFSAMIREVLSTQAGIFAQAYGGLEKTQTGSKTVFPASNRML